MAIEQGIDVTADHVRGAHARIQEHVRATPLERSETLSRRAGVDVYLKLECWQPTRSFKVRGALNAVSCLSARDRARGLVTASAGNHGQAVALAARKQGADAVVFVPHGAPAPKKDRIRRLGATLDDTAPDYDAAEAAAQEHARARGRVFINAFSDPAVVAGQGTIAIELLDALPGVREVIVPVGGGGLAAGIATWLAERAPDARVVGVQSERTRAMSEAYRAGQLVQVPIEPTLADGLAGKTDHDAFVRMRRLVPDIHIVAESSIAGAIRRLFREEGVVAEGAGAVPVAALETLDLGLRGPTVLVISGGNIDDRTFARVLLDSWP